MNAVAEGGGEAATAGGETGDAEVAHMHDGGALADAAEDDGAIDAAEE